MRVVECRSTQYICPLVQYELLFVDARYKAAWLLNEEVVCVDARDADKPLSATRLLHTTATRRTRKQTKMVTTQPGTPRSKKHRSVHLQSTHACLIV